MTINPLGNQLIAELATRASALAAQLEKEPSSEAQTSLSKRVNNIGQLLNAPQVNISELKHAMKPLTPSEASPEIRQAWRAIQGDVELLYLHQELSDVPRRLYDPSKLQGLKKLISELEPEQLQGAKGKELLFLCLRFIELESLVPFLVDKNAPLDGSDETGNTVWHYLAKQDQSKVMHKLWDKQPEGIWKRCNRSGETPADYLKDEDIIRKVVENKLVGRSFIEKTLLQSNSWDLLGVCLETLKGEAGFDLQSWYKRAIELKKSGAAVVLLRAGAMPEAAPEEREILASGLDSYIRNSAADAEFCQKCFEQGWGLLIGKRHDVNFAVVYKLIPIEQREAFLTKMQAQYGVSRAMLEILVAANDCLSGNPTEEQLDNVLNNLQPWVQRGEPGAKKLYNILGITSESWRKRVIRKRLDEYKAAHSPFSALHQYQFMREQRAGSIKTEWEGIEEYAAALERDVMDLAIQEDQYDHAVDFLLNRLQYSSAMENSVFGFLLDKWQQQNDFNGMNDKALPALQLKDALSAAVETPSIGSLDEADRVALRVQSEQLQKTLARYAMWELAKTSDVVSQVIVEEIKKAPVSVPILIPAGTRTHALAVAVQKTSADKATVFAYNTGGGIEVHHAVLLMNKDEIKYQTYVAIDEVPLSEITNPQVWQRLIASSFDKVDDLYKELYQLGGTKRPKSDNPLDYEQEQMQGTCAMQCLMAFLRHQMLQKDSAASWDKLGMYKFLKARAIHHIGTSQLAYLEPALKQNVELQLNRIALDFTLFKSVRDEKVYAEHLNALFALLKSHGESGIAETHVQTESVFGRYAHLRHVYSQVAKLNLSEKELEQIPVNMRKLIQKSDTKRANNVRKTIDKLNELYNAGKWEELMHAAFQIDPYVARPIAEWFAGRFSDIESAKNHPFILKIAYELAAAGIKSTMPFMRYLKDMGRKDLLDLFWKS